MEIYGSDPDNNGGGIDIDTKINNAITTRLNSLTKSSIGMNNVDNTSDLNKPISNATQAAINALKYTQIFEILYQTYSAHKYMKLGRLYLPLGGYRSIITINAHYGWNNNMYGLNASRYHFPNYRLTTYRQSPAANFSRSIFPGSLEHILSSPIFDNNNTSLFHSGYVVTTSPFIQPWGLC